MEYSSRSGVYVVGEESALSRWLFISRRMSKELRDLYIWRMEESHKNGHCDEQAEYSLFMGYQVTPVQIFAIKRELAALLNRVEKGTRGNKV